MKKYLAAAALLTLLLTGCAAPEDAGAPGLFEAPGPSVSASAAPSSVRVEPRSLEEAIQAAKGDHTDELKATQTLSALRRFAEAELKPAMRYEDWRDIMLFEMHTELDMLSDRSTEREFYVDVQTYALMVEDAALEAGLIR